MSGKSSFPSVLFKDLKVIITVMKVQFGKELGTLEMVNKVGDEEEEVCIANCPGVDVSIVLNHVFGVILFWDKEDW